MNKSGRVRGGLTGQQRVRGRKCTYTLSECRSSWQERRRNEGTPPLGVFPPWEATCSHFITLPFTLCRRLVSVAWRGYRLRSSKRQSSRACRQRRGRRTGQAGEGQVSTSATALLQEGAFCAIVAPYKMSRWPRMYYAAACPSYVGRISSLQLSPPALPCLGYS